MTDITELAQLRAELSNPAVGSKDHLRKLALSLVEALEKAQHRIADLESRTVKLSERYACELGYNALDPNGDMLDRDDVIAALTDAGIKVEAE